MSQLKTIVPGRFAVCGQPRPEQIADLAQQGYKTLIGNRPDREGADQPNAAQIESAAQQAGMDYIYMPVSLDSICRADVQAFHQALTSKPEPIVAHCASGRRSFVLWAASQVLFEGASVDDMAQKGQALGIDASSLAALVQYLGKNP